jgi:catechol 2,3-dioxygenase-like lactoylglutathione lyase family enzyme
MLEDTRAIATVAVRDLEKAAAFYEGILGLAVQAREGDEVVSYATGGTVLNVYRSQYAGTNKATSATWVVGDRLDAVVDALRARGVAFEHYDLPGLRREGDVHVGGDMRVAWFKDPDGNIHNLVSG